MREAQQRVLSGAYEPRSASSATTNPMRALEQKRAELIAEKQADYITRNIGRSRKR